MNSIALFWFFCGYWARVISVYKGKVVGLYMYIGRKVTWVLFLLSFLVGVILRLREKLLRVWVGVY